MHWLIFKTIDFLTEKRIIFKTIDFLTGRINIFFFRRL